MNKASVNTGVQISAWVPSFGFVGIYPEVDLREHMAIPCSSFWRRVMLFSSVCLCGLRISGFPGAAEDCVPRELGHGHHSLS